MTFHARNIKDLSIALEALTRVQNVDNEFSAIRDLLRTEIELKHKENHPLRTYTPPEPNRTEPDDSIPF